MIIPIWPFMLIISAFDHDHTDAKLSLYEPHDAVIPKPLMPELSNIVVRDQLRKPGKGDGLQRPTSCDQTSS